ncbi:MAG: hypothetical protein ACXWC5_32285, partial [Burkholderiales bacterium]
PKRPFKNLACRDRPAARPPVRNVLFGKVMANPLPLQIAQPNHSTLIAWLATGEAAVIRTFQERMPYGLFVPDVPSN